MTVIERWWRVVMTDGRTTWTDEDPNGKLDAAWTQATVHGPYVHAYATQGAVSDAERGRWLVERMFEQPRPSPAWEQALAELRAWSML